MYKRIPLQVLVFLLALGLFAYLVNRTDNVTHAQSDDFDRAQYANDNPVGDLEQLPETGEVNVMIELMDDATTRVYARALGNQSDRAADPQQRAARKAQHARKWQESRCAATRARATWAPRP